MVIGKRFCRGEAKRQADLAGMAKGTEPSVSKRESPSTVKGTPYRGTSRWSKLLKVSTLQRTIQIWSFALVFTVKYFLTTRKFTYGKKVRPCVALGMSTGCTGSQQMA